MEGVKTEISFDKYSAYQDSGIGWLAELPAHWDLLKLKQIFIEKKAKHNPALSCGAISFGEVVLKDDQSIPLSTLRSYQEVLEGEFLINPLNLNYDLKSLRIALSERDVVVSSGYIVLQNKIEISKSYFKWLLHRYDIAYMKLLGSGVRQTISYNHISNSLLPFPPLQEQTAIANFLNEKIAIIDKAIAQKERMIVLLKERQQIIIQNAVTKGLDPNIRMKDSGVEWIGEIPEHWEVTNSRWLFKERKERSRPDDIQLTSSQKHGVIPQEEYMRIENRRVTQVVYNKQIQKHVEVGDFMISMRSFQGGIEYSNYEGCISSAYIPLIPSDLVNHGYYKYLLKSPRYIEALQSTSNLVRDGQALRFENFKMVPLLAIPLDEQRLIAKAIKNSVTTVKKAVRLQREQISKLKEYKDILIENAVTGKIKVS